MLGKTSTCPIAHFFCKRMEKNLQIFPAGQAALREGKFLCISRAGVSLSSSSTPCKWRAHHTIFFDSNLSFATVFGFSELDGEGQKTQPKHSERQNSLLLIYSSVHCKPQKLSAIYVVQTNGILFKPHGRHQHAECPKIPIPPSIFSFQKHTFLCYIILSIQLPK